MKKGLFITFEGIEGCGKSTQAYQGAARKIDGKLIDTIRRYATFGLVPDITFLVDLPEEIGLSRILAKDADRLEQESIAFHKKVRNGFLELANKEPERFVVLDGNKSIKEIHDDVIDIICKELII